MQTIIDTGPDSSKMPAFNYASQALNNRFFLDTLVREFIFFVLHIRLDHVEKPPPANAFNNVP